MDVKTKPKTLACYLCGRQFGTNSLKIHLPNCEKKFLLEQSKRPPKERVALPVSPPQLPNVIEGNSEREVIEQYNQKALKMYKYSVLSICKYCGRTFNYESLAPHMNGCNKKTSYVSPPKLEEEPQIRKPRFLICCACGREFGILSLMIHYTQCIEKFINEQSQKARADQKTPPQFSVEQLLLLQNEKKWRRQTIDQFNKESQEKYRNEAMVQCYNCKRKFVTEAHQKHKKNCVLINGKLESKAQPKSEGIKDMDGPKKPKVLMCHICGRQFGLTSLLIHQKKCQQRFVTGQAKKEKPDRKKLPVMPDLSDFDFGTVETWTIQKIGDYNSIATEVYRADSLHECMYCHRKFFQESLAKHIKHCASNHKKSQKNMSRIDSKSDLSREESFDHIANKSDQCFRSKVGQSCKSSKMSISQRDGVDMVSQQEGPSEHSYAADGEEKVSTKLDYQELLRKPRVLMCHICGRQFGLTSLLIHQKKCQEKFLAAQSKKQDPKKLPMMPDISKFDFTSVEKWEIHQICEYNIIANQVYRKDSLLACLFCHRKFFEEALPKHIKHCANNHQKSQKLLKKQSMNQLETPKKCSVAKKASLDLELRQKIEDEKRSESGREKQPFVNIPEVGQDQQQTQKFCEKQLSKAFLPTLEDAQQQDSPLKIKIPQPESKDQCRRIQEQQEKSESNQSPQSQMQIQQITKQSTQVKKFQISLQKVSLPPVNEKEVQKVDTEDISHANGELEIQQNLEKCPKCDRKFNAERIQTHKNVCQGKKVTIKKHMVPVTQSIKASKKEDCSAPIVKSVKVEANQLPRKLKQPAKVNKKNVTDECSEVELKKTKEGFFHMVTDLKKKKINDDDIDREIEEELSKMPSIRSPAPKISRKQNCEHEEKLKPHFTPCTTKAQWGQRPKVDHFLPHI